MDARDFQKERKFLIDFKINGAVMCDLLGISAGNYKEKLNGVCIRAGKEYNADFNDHQKKLIRNYIKKLAKAAAKI